jgi:hypothetical protein
MARALTIPPEPAKEIDGESRSHAMLMARWSVTLVLCAEYSLRHAPNATSPRRCNTYVQFPV